MTGKTVRYLAAARWLRWSAVVAAAVAVVVVLLPVAIRFGAIHWLEEHGVEKAEIADVDLNLFAGTFAIEGLSVGDGLKVGRLAVEIDWWPMWERRLFIRSVEARNVKAVIARSEDGGWSLSSIQLPRALSDSATVRADVSEPWQLVLNDIDIMDVSLKADGKTSGEPFNLSLLVKSLRSSLAKAESGGGWFFKSRIKLGKLAFNGLGYAVENASLQLDNTLLLPSEAFDVSSSYHLKSVTIHDLQASIKRVKETTAEVQDTARPEKEAGKPSVAAVKSGKKMPSSAADAADKGAKATNGPKVYIGKFLVGEGSRVLYRDESLTPPFETQVTVEKLSFSPVDLSGKEKGNLDALLRLNKNGALAIQGELIPSSETAFADLKLALKNFDMSRLTAFVEPDFGRSIKTGQMDLTSKVKIASSKIEAKNKLTIRELKLEKAKQPGRAVQGLGMPLDTALDMLRDDRGDISLDVPVSGRLDDPDIDVSDAINKAVAKAMSSGVLAYAKLALQPYGTILMVGEFALEKAKSAAKPKLTPIRFNTRSAKLETETSDYLGKIAALMKQKDFRLEICGVATRNEGGGATSDQPVVLSDERLLQLADQRSDMVMQAIQGHGIAADRLFNCRPAIDEKKKDALPRVELILD